MLDPPRGASPSDDSAVKPPYQTCLTSERRGVRIFRHLCLNFLCAFLVVYVILKAALFVSGHIEEYLHYSKSCPASFALPGPV